MQYTNYRTEGLKDYFPCKLKNCKLGHIMIYWISLMIVMTVNYKYLSEQSELLKYHFSGVIFDTAFNFDIS